MRDFSITADDQLNLPDEDWFDHSAESDSPDQYLHLLAEQVQGGFKEVLYHHIRAHNSHDFNKFAEHAANYWREKQVYGFMSPDNRPPKKLEPLGIKWHPKEKGPLPVCGYADPMMKLEFSTLKVYKNPTQTVIHIVITVIARRWEGAKTRTFVASVVVLVGVKK